MASIFPKIQLSGLSKRRLKNFKSNKRGYYSFWIFMVLFTFSLFAEFFANERPIMVIYQGDIYFTLFKDYPETTFGGDLEINTEFRDPDVQAMVIDDGGGKIIWPIWRFSYNTIDFEIPEPAPAAPFWVYDLETRCGKMYDGVEDRNCTFGNWHLLGTDGAGRDIWARIIYGFRISVLFGLVLTILSSVIGIFVGATQGFFGGWIDLIGQRFIEIWSSVPSLYLLIILASIFTPSFWLLILVLLLFSWVALVGVVRAEVLRARNFEYIRAAKALGVSDRVIIMRHILPNAMVATITLTPFLISGAITSLTSLDFLGFGLQDSAPSLGEIVSQAKRYPTLPWLGITIFITLSIILSLLIFIGEAVRDAFDPRKTFQSEGVKDFSDEGDETLMSTQQEEAKA